MKLNIDPKSILVGLIISVFAMLAIGGAESSQSPVGRYQISTGGVNLLVDTATGQVWGITQNGARMLSSQEGFFDKKLPN